MEKTKTVSFDDMLKVNVNEFTEKKNGLTYLSWAHAWQVFKSKYPDATYRVVKDDSGKPYFLDEKLGIMCYTEVTVGNLTHEMWLPVMDGANKSMRLVPYQYKTKFGDKVCEGASMFDINKTIMRCIVKNLAMFGLGLYIYAGEDFPEAENLTKSMKPKLGKPDFDRAIKTIKDGKYTTAELLENFDLSPTQTKELSSLKNGKDGK